MAAEGTGYHTYAGGDEADNLVIKAAGGINIAGELPGDYIEVEAEWVLKENPDVILINDFDNIGYKFDDPSNASKIRDIFMNSPALKQTNAVKNGRVYLINWYSMVTEFFVGMPYISLMLYPDLIADMDPEGIHQEFLTRFRGLDYDLNDHGIFIYPPIEKEDGLAGVPDRYKEQQ
jgi:iron complex transport system substrate-binding protein